MPIYRLAFLTVAVCSVSSERTYNHGRTLQRDGFGICNRCGHWKAWSSLDNQPVSTGRLCFWCQQMEQSFVGRGQNQIMTMLELIKWREKGWNEASPLAFHATRGPVFVDHVNHIPWNDALPACMYV